MYTLPSTLAIYFLPLQLVFLEYITHVSFPISFDCFVLYLQSTAVLFNALLIL